jgi:lactoylglutathione lyase
MPVSRFGARRASSSTHHSIPPLMKLISLLSLGLAFGASLPTLAADANKNSEPPKPSVNLGAFSISLAVKDIAASRAFYEKLGFKPVLGDAAQHWLIMRNGETTIGLFQGMFKSNIMTFNPGWTSQATPLKEFEDIRKIQRKLKADGLTLTAEADEKTTGPASLTLVDPDGNQILLDQHVN